MSATFVAFEPVDFDPFAAGEVTKVISLTGAQREIWLACMMDPEASVAYNLSLTLTLRGELNVDALKQALRDLAHRHDALRMTFAADGRSATVNEARPFIREVDLRDRNDPVLGFQEVLRAEAEERYDLQTGPLFRATLARLSATETRVVLGAHHIVCDGWSLAVLIKELGPLYTCRCAGKEAGLEPAPSFVDHAASGPAAETEADLAYFVERLRDSRQPLELPTDHPRRPGRSIASSVARRTLDADLFGALKRRAAADGITPSLTLFTAWSVLLTRISGQDDWVMGLPIGLQGRIGKPGLVGHCTHLLPVRVRIDASRSLQETMRVVRSTVLDVCEHPFATVGDLMPRLSFRRDASRHPLLSVLFNFDAQFLSATPELDGCAVTFEPNPRAAETFEIFLNAYQDERGQLIIDCQYASELWEEATMMSWLSGLEAVIRTLAEAPETSVAKAPIVAADERSVLLERWNATEAAQDGSTVLLEIERIAAARPDQVALRDAERSLTYRQLLERAQRIAEALRGVGVGRSDLVGLCVTRGVWMVPLMLGIWGAGAAYVPIDPEYPQRRIAQMTRRLRLLVVDDDTADAVSEVEVDRVVARELVDYEHAGSLSVQAGDAAYVIYTSGSTGTPKGVEVTHRNLFSFVASMRHNPGVGPEDVVAAVVTLSFDIAGFELFVPLAAGATVVVADAETTRDGRDLAALMTREGVTMLQATPSTYRLLRASGFEPKGLRALVGGEAFPPDLARWLLDGGARVTNCYGPTETTIWSAIHTVTRADGPIPIGRPLDGTRIYVLGADGEPVPRGCYGEIVIGGAGVARGYLDEPELTSERFVANRFQPGSGERMYRTGDLGRWRHDGVLEIAGRNDDQVKLRGHRIELGEIEAAIAGLDGVVEAAATILRPEEGEPRLAAFIVVERGKAFTATDLRRELRRRLPESMIPGMVTEVGALPKTLNGKIDRRQLVTLAVGDRRASGAAAVPTRTKTETTIAAIFEKLLKAPAVGASDNFFDLGGDSIGSVEAAVAIEKLTRVRISPRDLLLGCVSDVARLVDERSPRPVEEKVNADQRNHEP